MNNESPYLVKILFAALVLLGLVAIFNATIDPYTLFRSPSIAGLNEKKTDLFYQLHVAKPHQFYAMSNARNVILGSSRAGRAINPDHPLLGERGFYNYATPGANPEYDYLKLRSAIASGPVKYVYYFVDFFSFNSYGDRHTSIIDAFRKRTLPGTVSFAQQALMDYGASLLGYHATRDSVQTLRKQLSAESGIVPYTNLYPNGFWHWSFADGRNTEQAFIFMENVYLKENWLSSSRKKFSLHDTPKTPHRPFFYFEALLQMAQEHDLEMVIVILPVHARLLENLDYVGLWPNFEYWKRQLVSINENIATAAHVEPFPLWDFNGYNEMSIEPVSNAALPRWFYDSAHTHVNAGNRILDLISTAQPNALGSQLNSSNIERWLAHQRNEQARYRDANPALTADITRRVEKFKKQNQHYIEPPPSP